MVRSTNVVSSKALGADNKNNGKKAGGGEFGAKLTKIVENVKEIVTKKEERVLIFVQFRDLKEKVAQALESHGVKTLQVNNKIKDQRVVSRCNLSAINPYLNVYKLYLFSVIF